MTIEDKAPHEVPPVEDSASPEQPPVPTATPGRPSGTWPAKDVTESDRLLAGLAYVSQVILPIVVPAVMLLSEENKKRAFQKYHAIQALGLLAAVVIYEVLAGIVFTVLSVVTGGCLACFLWVLFFLPVVPACYYAYQAYKGLYFTIPFLTDFLLQSKWLEMPPE